MNPRILLLFCFAILGNVVKAQQSVGYLDSWMRPNGSVNAVVRHGNTIYLGGEFTSIGYAKPYFALLDTATGQPDLTYPSPNGTVYSSVSDGAGGWYLCGEFTKIGDSARKYLARINANGSISGWNPRPNGLVYSLALSGSTLYVGGRFDTISGLRRKVVAALSTTTGQPTSWSPEPYIYYNSFGPYLNVSTIAVSGNTVYIGGNFTSINGQSVGNIAGIDAVTGQLTNFNPVANAGVGEIVVSGNTVYVSGSFWNIGGQPRNSIAALDASTGLANFWDPNPTSGNVSSFALSGNTMYVGGDFDHIGGQYRSGIAALDITTGLANSWNPYPNGTAVYVLLVKGTKVYVGGLFSYIGGQSRSNIAALDTSTGLATSWNPLADGYVSALSMSAGQISVGGNFVSIGGEARNRLAALDANTGQITSWNPNANGTVSTLAIKDSTIYAGGDFTSVGGQNRSRLGALNGTSGLATTWSPNANGLVSSIVVSGSTVYAGGQFTSIGGQNRSYIAALSANTGLATSWNPGANAEVAALALSGSTIYAGGSFAVIGGQPRSGIAAINSSTGLATNWNPNANNSVSALLVSGNTVFAGGSFVSIGGQNRHYLAALSVSTGAATNWNPQANSNVSSLAKNGSNVYAGGNFNTIGGQGRSYLAAINATTGLVTSWNPRANNSVRALALSGNTIYAGGSFTQMNDNASRRYFMGLVDSTQVLSPSSAPVIDSLAPSVQLCKGGSVTISFTASGIQNGNIYTAQLSSSTGSFNAPTVLGTLISAANSGTITATIPASQASGTGYRIRVLSSLPSLTGANNGTNLSISSVPTSTQAAITPSTLSQSICLGSSQTYSLPTNAAIDYQWLLGGNPIVGAANNSYTASVAGVYSASVTNAGGCSRTSSSRTLTIVPGPIAQITSPVAPPNLCNGATATLQAATASGNAYQWLLNGSAIVGATLSSYTATVAGSYTVKVTNSACTNQSVSPPLVVTSFCGPTISNTGTLNICSGNTITASFTGSAGTGNTFTLELSDASGSFASPIGIGSLATTSGGAITGTIPASTPGGNGYRLRITSSAPATTGPPSALTLKIKPSFLASVPICAVTVDSATGLNRIIFTKPQVAGIDSFVFYRRPVVGVNYVRAGAIGYAQLSTWLDSASEPQTRSEQYYMTAKNTCGQSAPSDTHRTLLLTINQGWLSADWNLIWNGYEGATHTGYNIYRGGTPNNLSLLTSISANTYNAFIDHNGPNGMVYYKVALADGPICTPGLRTSGGGEGLICSNIASRLDPSAVYTDLALYPNPSDGAGTALVQTNGRDENFSLRITDILGRIVEHREAVANTPLNFGSSFAPGIYLVEAISKEGVRIARRWVKK